MSDKHDWKHYPDSHIYICTKCADEIDDMMEVWDAKLKKTITRFINPKGTCEHPFLFIEKEMCSFGNIPKIFIEEMAKQFKEGTHLDDVVTFSHRKKAHEP